RIGPCPTPSKWIRNAAISAKTSPLRCTHTARPPSTTRPTTTSAPHPVPTASTRTGTITSAHSAVSAGPAQPGRFRRGVGRSIVCNRFPTGRRARSTRIVQGTGARPEATVHDHRSPTGRARLLAHPRHWNHPPDGPRQTAGVTAPLLEAESADDPYLLAASAASELLERLGPHRVAVVLRRGGAPVADRLGPVRASMPASVFTGVPAPTVPGHDGAYHSVLAQGADGQVPVLVMAGRSHLYEGHPVATVVHPVRAAVLAGCSTVILTNAAGSLRPEVGPGTPVLISDHLNLTGSNPMCGPLPPSGMPGRFVDVTDLYSARRREAIRAAAPDLVEGVYAGLLGASFETPAEI